MLSTKDIVLTCALFAVGCGTTTNRNNVGTVDAAVSVPPALSVGEGRVHIIDSGIGMCALVEAPCANGSIQRMLFDCGLSGGAQKTDVAKYVNSVLKGSSSLLFLSHPHQDHRNIVGDITTRWDQAYFGGSKVEWSTWADKLSSVTPTYVSDPNALPFVKTCDGVGVQIVAGGNASVGKDNMNDRSLIVRVSWSGFSAVFAGDATAIAENAALSGLGPVTLLNASHHGAATNGSNSEAWVQALRPQIVTYSVGLTSDGNTKNGHPNKDVVARYKKHASHASEHDFIACESSKNCVRYREHRSQYTTATNGTIIVTSNARGVEVGCSRASCALLSR